MKIDINISNGKAIKRGLFGFRIWIIIKFTVIEIKKVIETARLLTNAIFSLFCFDKKVIYRRIVSRKYKKQTIMIEKGFTNYQSL